MLRRRLTWLRTCALAMLLLAGVDLVNPECCAGEIAAAASALATTVDGSANPLPTQAPAPDDCFCCARSIDVTIPLTAIVLQLRTSVFSLPDPNVRVRPAAIDHPPQLA